MKIDINQILASFEQEEQEMQHNLANLAEHGPEHAYKTYARACVRMRAQIAIRRKMVGKWKKDGRG